MAETIGGQHKPKFKVGQVVRTYGSHVLRQYMPDYWRVLKIQRDDQDRYIYCVSDHDARGPWIAEKQVRALSKKERGA